MRELAYTVPGYGNINPPGGIPQGGFSVLGLTSKNIIIFAMSLAIIIALIFLIWGGIGWISSGGDKAKIAQAQARITYAVLGLILIFLSIFLVNFVGYFFNVKFF